MRATQFTLLFFWLAHAGHLAPMLAKRELLEQIGDVLANQRQPVQRQRCHAMAVELHNRVSQLTGLPPIAADLDLWFGQMIAMRKREGESLRNDIVARLATIRTLKERLAEHREEVRDELLASYQQRVQEIAAAAAVQVAEDRIAQEVVMMVEKGDIAEELTRLAHHVEQVDAAIEGREPAGKKLDFLSQEFNREANTLCSKAQDLELTRTGLKGAGGLMSLALVLLLEVLMRVVRVIQLSMVVLVRVL